MYEKFKLSITCSQVKWKIICTITVDPPMDNLKTYVTV